MQMASVRCREHGRDGKGAKGWWEWERRMYLTAMTQEIVNVL